MTFAAGLDPLKLYGNPPGQLRTWARSVRPTIPAHRPGTPGHHTAKESIAEMIRRINATEKALAAFKMKLAIGRAHLSGFRYLPNEVFSRILAIHLNSNEDTPFGHTGSMEKHVNGLDRIGSLPKMERCRSIIAVMLEQHCHPR
jgi:hypothetical protein